MITWLKQIFDTPDDPIYRCIVFKEQGCSHVDGPLCDFPYCPMIIDYQDTKKDC